MTTPKGVQMFIIPHAEQVFTYVWKIRLFRCICHTLVINHLCIPNVHSSWSCGHCLQVNSRRSFVETFDAQKDKSALLVIAECEHMQTSVAATLANNSSHLLG